MLPIGPLMIEHRLIERMIKIMDAEAKRIEKEGVLNLVLIDKTVDFIRTYADRCHHGKEEGILFRELKKKNLSKEHEKTMDELVEEHKLGREVTGSLAKARERAAGGNHSQVADIVEIMRKLVNFYPKHIEKEDKHFFMPVMGYFTELEKQEMLKEGYEFDQKLIHEKYRVMVEEFEKSESQMTEDT
jgi:hemerythrin-like domain-containing protein